jgi:hypothetical protein
MNAEQAIEHFEKEVKRHTELIAEYESDPDNELRAAVPTYKMLLSRNTIVLAALRAQQERECPRALTLGELKERVGKHVWILAGDKPMPVRLAEYSEGMEILRWYAIGTEMVCGTSVYAILSGATRFYAHEPKEARRD